MTTVRLQGAGRFRADIAEARQKLADLRPVHSEAARVVLSTAQPQTPRRTGQLAASMRMLATDGSGRVLSDLVYAPVIHYGWRGHGIESQPWLVNAAHASEPRWVQLFERLVDESLDLMDKVYSR